MDFEGLGVLITLLVMAVLWITEWIPIGVTSLLPLVVFPVLGVATLPALGAEYLNGVLLVFLVGFFIAISIEESGLHHRLLERILGRAQVRPEWLLLKVMLGVAFASMWMSNTAAFMVFFPLIQGLKHVDLRLKKALLLGGAYAASIGGIGTPVGSPPNLILISFLKQKDLSVPTFLEWMLKGIPLVILMLAALWGLLCWGFKIWELPRTHPRDPNGPTPSQVGSEWSKDQKWSLGITCAILMAWLVGPRLGVSDAQVSLVGIFAFLVSRRVRPQHLKKMPWEVLLLMGGGLALSVGIQNSGILQTAFYRLQDLGQVSSWTWLALVVSLSVLATEFISNTAMAAIVLPIVWGLIEFLSRSSAPLAPGFDESLLWGCVLAGSLSFMMPMATPVNALAFSSKVVRIHEMIRYGAIMNLLTVIFLTLFLGSIAK